MGEGHTPCCSARPILRSLPWLASVSLTVVFLSEFDSFVYKKKNDTKNIPSLFPVRATSKLHISLLINWTSTQKGLLLVGSRVEDVDRFCEVATGGGM